MAGSIKRPTSKRPVVIRRAIGGLRAMRRAISFWVAEIIMFAFLFLLLSTLALVLAPFLISLGIVLIWIVALSSILLLLFAVVNAPQLYRLMKLSQENLKKHAKSPSPNGSSSTGEGPSNPSKQASAPPSGEQG